MQSVTYPFRGDMSASTTASMLDRRIRSVGPGGRYADAGMVMVTFADGETVPICKDALDEKSPGWRTLYREEAA